MKSLHIAMAFISANFLAMSIQPLVMLHRSTNYALNIRCSDKHSLGHIGGAEFFLTTTTHKTPSKWMGRLWQNKETTVSLQDTEVNPNNSEVTEKSKPFLVIDSNGDAHIMRWWRNYHEQCAQAVKTQIIRYGIAYGIIAGIVGIGSGIIKGSDLLTYPARFILGAGLGTLAVAGIDRGLVAHFNQPPRISPLLKNFARSCINAPSALWNAVKHFPRNFDAWYHTAPVNGTLKEQIATSLGHNNVPEEYELVESPALNEAITRQLQKRLHRRCALCAHSHHGSEAVSTLLQEARSNTITTIFCVEPTYVLGN